MRYFCAFKLKDDKYIQIDTGELSEEIIKRLVQNSIQQKVRALFGKVNEYTSSDYPEDVLKEYKTALDIWYGNITIEVNDA